MNEIEKYEWLYSHTNYARLRPNKHFDQDSHVIIGSYWHRIWTTIHAWYESLDCQGPILDVGSGPCNLARVARDVSDFPVVSLDFASSAKPDIVAPVYEMPCKNDEYDLVTSVDMLEHVPEDLISHTLTEIARVTKRGAFFSIHYGCEHHRWDETGPLHVTIHKPDWWRARIDNHFSVIRVARKLWYLQSK